MLTQIEKESVFRECGLFSKEDLVKSFSRYMSYVEEEDETGATELVRSRRIELCKKFLAKLDACKLPELNELWWYYEYEFRPYSIDLNLCVCSDITGDSVDDCTLETTVEHTLFNVECEMLTPEEYAKDWGVTPITVRQWIRRGKLRTAKKIGREWFIPSLADRPERGYEMGAYGIEEPGSIVIDEYPLVAASDYILIIQDKKNKKEFTCRFSNRKSGMFEELKLNRKEVEALEYALIASGKTHQVGSIQFVPSMDD